MRKKRQEGKKTVIWSLCPEQKEYIQSLGYSVEEFLYKVFFRRKIHCVYKNSPAIVKEIKRRERTNKENYFVKPLKSTERKTLDEYRCV